MTASRKLTISVLGYTVLDVAYGPPPEPSTSAPPSQPEGEAPGPVTDRRGGPTLGFSSPPRDVHMRPVIR